MSDSPSHGLQPWLKRAAITWVNHAGASLVKVVPRRHLDKAADLGVGFSPVADAFRVDGCIAPSHRFARPDEDLRLHAVVEALAPLEPDRGWAWAPGERRWRDGRAYEADQRSFCRLQQDCLQQKGLTLQAGFELEWMVFAGDPGTQCSPAFPGGPYGADRLVEGLDYASEICDALDAAGLDWLQFHPEYGASQFELSLAHASAVEAADRLVLARLVIQRVSRRLGLRCSFTPKLSSDEVGNGGHVHFSLRRHGQPVLQGGDGPGGVLPEGAALIAGVLHHLPALLPIACPLSASYARLAPSSWSAPYQVWGIENREAALRLVPTSVDQVPAHLELKVADLGANPYLLLGSLQVLAMAALSEAVPLPEPVRGDPARVDGTAAAHARLPQSLAEGRTTLASSAVLSAAMGELLHGSVLDSIDAEIARCEGLPPDQVIASTRWWPLVGGLS